MTRSVRNRARINRREVVVALALTVGAAIFMMTTFTPATPSLVHPGDAMRR